MSGRPSRTPANPKEAAAASETGPPKEAILAIMKQIANLTAAVKDIERGMGTMDEEQLTSIVKAIDGTAPSPPIPPAKPVYARNPGQLNPDSFIDYSTSTGMKMYKAATAPLKDKFDHTNGKVIDLSTSLRQRSDESGWGSGDGAIDIIQDTSGNKRKLFEEY